VFSITELKKPAGEWCAHCDIGVGCKIYPSRPQACVTFNCSYLMTAWIDESWKPSRCGMVIHADPRLKRVLVRVDPAQPDAWRTEPYHSQLRRWAAEWAPSRSSILVLLNDDAWVVFPDRDVPFPAMQPDETIVTQWSDTAFGPRLEAFRSKLPSKPASDPPLGRQS
jgi:hypothetical protein